MENCCENFNISDVDRNEICRLCLTREGEMSPIFSRPSDVKSISIPYRIMAFTSIKLETGDGLPGLICHSCLFNVERVFEFKQQCEQSDALLRKYLLPKNYQDLKFESDGENCLNFNGTLSNGDVSHQSKIDEDNEGVVKSPLKQGLCDKDGIESVIMVVDPNAKTLDASSSDNDNDNQHDNDDELAFSSNVVEGESTKSYCIGNATPNINKQLNDNGFVFIRCPSCNKPFINQSLLDRHKMIHTQDPFFPCDFCEMIFNDRASLKSHWRDHAGLGKLTCMTCGESFTERSALDQHVIIHDIIKPFHCAFCNRAFSNRSDLRKHLVIHSGARPFICDVCGKSFTRSTNLNKHAKMHAGNRPFSCPECPKKFSTRADLTRHSVTHSGEKPYSCHICGLAFSRRDKLTRHIRLHEKNNRPFFCEECALSFNNRKVLASHYQLHHKNLALPKELRNCKEYLSETNARINNLSIMRNLLTACKPNVYNRNSEDIFQNEPSQSHSSYNVDVEIVETSSNEHT